MDEPEADTRGDVRALAFYLPQFHPIPENDEWWGPGFTEWRNVTRARPLFRGHYQPRLPRDLGFYDLRLQEVKVAQAELARAYGLAGFCYYHYWFGGRRLLQRPFDETLASGVPDFPFALCWANENWTRAWDGGAGQVLVQQHYSEEDDRNHMEWLVRAFEDERYIRVHGRPLFLIYRAAALPDVRRTLETWRTEARRHGVGELYLCKVESFAYESTDPQAEGFDAAVGFIPDYHSLGRPLRRTPAWRVARKARLSSQAYGYDNIFEFEDVVEQVIQRPKPAYQRFECVTTGWDNTPRRKEHAVVWRNATPEGYERWLRHEVRLAARKPREERLVFINAWNEWAEGAHLEPCLRWELSYLEATKRALQG